MTTEQVFLDWSDPAEVDDWRDRALCAQTDPELMYPEKGGSTREAKKLCAGCVVRVECLGYALDHGERYGVWGGLSERERRRLLKTRGVVSLTDLDGAVA